VAGEGRGGEVGRLGETGPAHPWPERERGRCGPNLQLGQPTHGWRQGEVEWPAGAAG